MTLEIKKKWNATTVARSIHILSRSDQRKILLVISIQIFLSLFDLLAIAAVGVLGALAVNGVQSKAPGNRVAQVLELFHLEDFSFQSQVATIGFIAASIMICRTILSVYFGRKTLFFLSRRSAAISSELISKLLTKPLNIIQKNTTQETIYALTSGVNAITVGVIGTVVSIVSDVSILFVMSIGLIAVDVLTAGVIFALFGVVAYILYSLMHKKISFLGYENSRLSIDGSEKIVQVLSAYREAIVGNRRDYYAKEIGNSRFSLANVNAETAFLPNVSKYVIEVTVVLAALIVSALQFTFNDASHAVAALVVSGDLSCYCDDGVGFVRGVISHDM
jgi:ATP-binding cassette subfamily C protein